jgi:hypothetical protein
LTIGHWCSLPDVTKSAKYISREFLKSVVYLQNICPILPNITTENIRFPKFKSGRLNRLSVALRNELADVLCVVWTCDVVRWIFRMGEAARAGIKLFHPFTLHITYTPRLSLHLFYTSNIRLSIDTIRCTRYNGSRINETEVDTMFPNIDALTQRDFDIMDALDDARNGYTRYCPKCDHPALFIEDGTDDVYADWWDYRCPVCDTEFRVVHTDDMDDDEYTIRILEPSPESKARALIGKTIADHTIVRYWMETDIETGELYPVLVLRDNTGKETAVAYNIVVQG